MRRLRRHIDEERPREPVPADQVQDEREDERGLVDEALRLQTLLGNRNVTELIARAPLQRDDGLTTAAGGAPQAEPADKGDKPAPADGHTIKIDGIEDPFELESLSWSTQGAGGREKPGIKELVASAKSGKQTAKLMEFAAKGTRIATVVIQMRKGGKTYLTLTLKDVAISSFQTGGGQADSVDQFSMNPGAVEFEYAGDSKEGDGGGGDWGGGGGGYPG